MNVYMNLELIKKEIIKQLELDPDDIFWNIVTGQHEIHQLILLTYEILIGYWGNHIKMVIIDDEWIYHFAINSLDDVKINLLAYLYNKK